MIELEHVNVTVSDPHKTAKWMNDIFGWDIRWEGASMDGQGYTVHVGTPNSYVALYAEKTKEPRPRSYSTAGGLNHIAVVVDDFDATANRVKKHFKLGEHYDYEPGRRFYFFDDDGIEYEVVSYA